METDKREIKPTHGAEKISVTIVKGEVASYAMKVAEINHVSREELAVILEEIIREL
jgi:hypothetical protein